MTIPDFPALPNRRTRGAVARTVRGAAACALLLLAGCAAVGPDYSPPADPVPANWQAATPHEGSTVSLLDWWTAFDDPVLDRLQRAAQTDNPTLDQAAAAIGSARATLGEAGAAALPRVNAGASATRSGSWRGDSAASSGSDPALVTGGLYNQSATSTARSGGLDASWEIDLFGAVRRSREAASARLEARQAEWHDARVSLAAEVATEYVNFRACQMLAESQRANLESLNQTAASTRVAAENGFSAPADASLANAARASAAATLNVQEAECELGVKALVALTGLDEPALRQTLAAAPARIPEPAIFDVAALPVRLLSQRPDLVAAERSLAGASADIGVAQANRYPRLSLLGSIAVGRTETSGLSIDTSPWSFGPSLSLPLFDGGALRARVAGARATYDSALAGYRTAVRGAVRETEQSLVRLDAANRRTQDVTGSARDYRRYFDAAQENWRAGGISLLTLEEARRNALSAEQNAIGTRRDRVLHGVALYKALGGGWERAPHTGSNGVSR